MYCSYNHNHHLKDLQTATEPRHKLREQAYIQYLSLFTYPMQASAKSCSLINFPWPGDEATCWICPGLQPWCLWRCFAFKKKDLGVVTCEVQCEGILHVSCRGAVVKQVIEGGALHKHIITIQLPDVEVEEHPKSYQGKQH